ncbi:unnamed protein product [marine sediment metagenome]|uniref:Uncharacterized protein n=1 Tax=marine sediment metagenome TaxID=412755 RepID=X1DXV7_9ZZZZ
MERKKKLQLYRKKYYQKNREKLLAYQKKLRDDYPDYYKDCHRKRRLDRINAIFEEFGYSVEAFDRMGGTLN